MFVLLRLTLGDAAFCQKKKKVHLWALDGSYNKQTVNIYAVQQDTQSVLMSEFIQHLC